MELIQHNLLFFIFIKIFFINFKKYLWFFFLSIFFLQISNSDMSEFVRICPKNPDKFGQVRIQNEPPRHTHGGLHRYISQYLLGRHQNQYWIRSRSPRRVSEPLLLSLFTVGDFSDKFGQIRTCPESRLSETLMLRKKSHFFFHICKKNIYSGSQKRFFWISLNRCENYYFVVWFLTPP